MDYQTITAPDGSEMVVLSRSAFDTLLAAAEERLDVAEATAALTETRAIGTIPVEIVDDVLAGMTPVAAWRKYRGFSQAQLARIAGLTQPGMRHFETRRNGRAHKGRDATREALAKALGIDIRMLDIE